MACIHSLAVFKPSRTLLAARSLVLMGTGLAAALLAGAVGAPPASAAWTAPAYLSAAGGDDYVPEVAVDDDGDYLFAWQRYDGTNFRAQVRTLSAAGTLGSVQTISPAGSNAYHPAVEMDSDGDAVLGWDRDNSVGRRTRVRTLSAAGALGVNQPVSNAGTDGFSPQLAVADDGDAVLAWFEADSRLYGRTLSAAGALGPIVPISDAGQPAYPGDVAVDPAGNAVFTWYRSDGTDLRVEARTLSAAGVLGAVQSISDAGQNALAPDVAVDAAGNAVMTWHRFDGSNDRIQARTLSATGILGSVRTLSDAGQSAFESLVELDASGNAVVIWYRSDGSNLRIQARTMSSVGTLGLVKTLSSAGQDATMPHLAVADDGDAVITWQRFDTVEERIEARTLSAAGSLGATWTISDAGGSAYYPRVAAHDDDAIVTWYQADSTGDLRILYSAGP